VQKGTKLCGPHRNPPLQNRKDGAPSIDGAHEQQRKWCATRLGGTVTGLSQLACKELHEIADAIKGSERFISNVRFTCVRYAVPPNVFHECAVISGFGKLR